MRYSELVEIRLTEDAIRDMNFLARAKIVSSAFCAYLCKHNENTPLADCPGVKRTSFANDDIYYINAHDLDPDIPYRSLNVGFMFPKEGQMDDRRATYYATLHQGNYALFNCPSDPGAETDLAFGLRWNSMVHEVTHYLDHRRFRAQAKWGDKKTNDGGELKKAKLYYNNPVEMNAHFAQGLDSMFNMMSSYRQKSPEKQAFFKDGWLTNYEDFRDAFYGDFKPEWIKYLSDANRKKVESRFYKLFVYLKQNWPNIEAIEKSITR